MNEKKLVEGFLSKYQSINHHLDVMFDIFFSIEYCLKK